MRKQRIPQYFYDVTNTETNEKETVNDLKTLGEIINKHFSNITFVDDKLTIGKYNVKRTRNPEFPIKKTIQSLRAVITDEEFEHFRAIINGETDDINWLKKDIEVTKYE